ncbi:unnamed protein product [Periconia digitata]|uniref:Rhodopsin domain-containing protein n=1 Tax=Periconia digitata TaxID=1303443 RepID=A0A9W4XX50_9PLEO|nr:unnamed protein product [Periconia digitata]
MPTVSPPLIVDDPRLDIFARKHYAAVYTLIPLTTFAIILRIYTRRHKGARLALDDTFAILTWAFTIGLYGFLIHGFKNGAVGHARGTLPKKNGRQVAMLTYAAPIVITCIITLAKLSVLFLYQRVFTPIRSFQIQIWVVGGLCTVWFFATAFPAIFKCSPVRAGWEPSLMVLPSTKCFDFQKWALSTEVVSGVLDFAVAGIAIGVLRHVQMNWAQKAGLLVLFLLTTLVAIIGAIRISLTYRLNVGGNFAPDEGIFWASIQSGICVICCCLPTYGSILNSFTRGIKKMRSQVVDTYGTSKFSIPRSGTTQAVDNSEYELGSTHSDGIPLAAPYWKMGSTQSGDGSKSGGAAS